MTSPLRRPGLILAALMAVLGSFVALTPAQAASGAPPSVRVDAQKTAHVFAAATRLACAGPAGCPVVSITQQLIADGVQETSVVLRVGPGVHDVMGLHRVVAVHRDGRPVVSRHPVFMLHGDVWGFEAAFAGQLGGPNRAPNIATYLAQRGMDVWGMDRRWVLTPAATVDTSFMRPWGFATDLADLRLATTVERGVRSATGDGSGRTALLGWSSGGAIAYAYAEAEARMPAESRNVSALIPAETLARYNPADTAGISNACSGYQYSNDLLTAGTSAFNLQAYYGQEGRAALSDPNGPSPYPGYTNLQAALYDGASGGGVTAWYHFVGGYFDAHGNPTALRYTPLPKYLHLLMQSAGFESQRDTVDLLAMWCGTVGSPYGTHLASITIPVLDLAVAGGFGTSGDYSTTLLGSRDVTRVLVRLHPVGQELIDYGHVDLWQGTRAADLAWRPLLRWLSAHTTAAN